LKSLDGCLTAQDPA